MLIKDLPEVIKKPADMFMNDTMFVRTIFCNPDIEQRVKNSVMSDDIMVYTCDYIEPLCYICSKDVRREVVMKEHGYDRDDFANNTYTIVMETHFY